MKNEFNEYEAPNGYDKLREGVEYGTITKIEYYSKTTEAVRRANVWLPSGYNENKRYPVLYLLHGIGGDENEWLLGRIEYILGNLILEKEAVDMIVVLPNVRARKDDLANPKDIFTLQHFKAFDNFINDLKNDLMPYIENNYSIKTGRNNTAITGLSMGGREALYIGFTLYETFGYIGAFCPAFGIFEYFNNGVVEEGLFTEENFKIPYDLQTLIMIVKGKADSIVLNEPVRYHNALIKNDVNHIYYEIEGGHDFKVWNNGLYNFVKRIFKNN
ncbi:MAG: alpha/beta hydrolase-fold protein [Clostridium celatum]|nr:alpha/beta hydrolase-fold protein [Clostridium celatum]